MAQRVFGDAGRAEQELDSLVLDIVGPGADWILLVSYCRLTWFIITLFYLFLWECPGMGNPFFFFVVFFPSTYVEVL